MTNSESIKIRPYKAEDAISLLEAAKESLSTVGTWLNWCTPNFNLETAQNWVDSKILDFQSQAEYEFAIVSDQNRFIGGCGLNAIHRCNARANLGYWIRASATKHGVATQAVRQLVQWAFQNTDLIRLEIVVATDNHASLRVAEKVGAVREGILRQYLRIHEKFHDAVMFSILKSDMEHR